MAALGELSRALALCVALAYDPELVVGGSLRPVSLPSGRLRLFWTGRPFHSRSRRFRRNGSGKRQRSLGSAPADVRGRRVLIVDETCDSGEPRCGWRCCRPLIRAGAVKQVRTAVCFKTGTFEADFYALATESTIVLPWDREVLVEGELVPNPMYEGV